MTNWVLIYVNKVVAVIEKEGNINDSDFAGNWDSVAQDDSRTFKVGDEFTSELQIQYNTELWKEKGWYVEPVVFPEGVLSAEKVLKQALKDANIRTITVVSQDA